MKKQLENNPEVARFAAENLELRGNITISSLSLVLSEKFTQYQSDLAHMSLRERDQFESNLLEELLYLGEICEKFGMQTDSSSKNNGFNSKNFESIASIDLEESLQRECALLDEVTFSFSKN